MKFGIRDRGQIKEGNFADLVIFDPDKVIDKATWQYFMDVPFAKKPALNQLLLHLYTILAHQTASRRNSEI